LPPGTADLLARIIGCDHRLRDDAHAERARREALGTPARGQARLATMSTNSARIVAKRSGHVIQWDQPKLVIAAIRQVVEAVRTQGRVDGLRCNADYLSVLRSLVADHCGARHV
jgi:hypothetical protein